MKDSIFSRHHAALLRIAHRPPACLSVLRIASASARIVSASALLLGSCYRAEIDLSPLAETRAGAPSLSEIGGSGQQVATGDGGEFNEATRSNCQDPPFSPDDLTCHITGEKPTRSMCVADPKGWHGCYDGGCSVCTHDGVVPGYPYYFKWHPCCSANDTCSNHDPFRCNPLCPQPTEHDKVAPCGENDPNPG